MTLGSMCRSVKAMAEDSVCIVILAVCPVLELGGMLYEVSVIVLCILLYRSRAAQSPPNLWSGGQPPCRDRNVSTRTRHGTYSG